MKKTFLLLLSVAFLGLGSTDALASESPAVTAVTDCGRISGILHGGSQEEWFLLFDPNGADVWDGSLTVRANEDVPFEETDLEEGEYVIATQPRFPVDSPLTQQLIVYVDCQPRQIINETTETEATLPETGFGALLFMIASIISLMGGVYITSLYRD